MKIGVLILLRKDTDILKEMQKVRDLELDSCQINVWDPELYSQELADRILDATRQTGIEISTLWAGWSGPQE